MADAGYSVVEIRIIVEHPELTEAYVLINAIGDAPLGVQGWHHKTFPASMSAVDIISKHAGDWVLWAQEAPPQR